jgi:hypothetical protein
MEACSSKHDISPLPANSNNNTSFSDSQVSPSGKYSTSSSAILGLVKVLQKRINEIY